MKKLLVKLFMLASLFFANVSSTFAMGNQQELDPVERDDSNNPNSTPSSPSAPGSGQALGTNIPLGTINSMSTNSNLPEEYLKKQRKKYEKRQKGKEKVGDVTTSSQTSSSLSIINSGTTQQLAISSASPSASKLNHSQQTVSVCSSNSNGVVEDDVFFDPEGVPALAVSGRSDATMCTTPLFWVPDDVLLKIMKLVAEDPDFEKGIKDLLSMGSTCKLLHDLLKAPCLSLEKLNIVLSFNEARFVERLILSATKLVEFCDSNGTLLQNFGVTIGQQNTLRIFISILKNFIAQGRVGIKLDAEFFETVRLLDRFFSQIILQISEQGALQLMSLYANIFNLNIDNGADSFFDKFLARSHLIFIKQLHEKSMAMASERANRNMLRALSFAMLGFFAMCALQPLFMEMPTSPDERTLFQRVFPICGFFTPAIEYGMKKIIPERIKRVFCRFLLRAKHMIYRGTKLGLEGISILMGFFFAFGFLDNFFRVIVSSPGADSKAIAGGIVMSSIFISFFYLIHRFM